MKSRALENIELEAEAYVRFGTPMPKRDPKWQQAIEDAIAKAKTLYKTFKVMTALETIRAKEEAMAARRGLTYDEWLAEAKKFYTIDPTTHTVTSCARSPNTPPQPWKCSSDIEAREKVLELIRYKDVDHHQKGHTFAWKKD